MANLLNKKNDELRDLAVAAHKRGDKATFAACLDELEERSSRKAARVRDELLALGRLSPANAKPARAGPKPKAASARPLEGPELLIDEQIAPRREQLVRQARRSVWLSSLTFPSTTLVDALVSAGRRDVRITLLVADRSVRDRHLDDLERLLKASVECIFPESTHSKILVVDDRHVMIGSANAHGGDRDACVLMSDAAMAAQAIEYLAELSELG